MIEVDLNPQRERFDRDRPRFALRRLARAGSWHEFRADPWHRAFVASAVLVPLAVGGAWHAQRVELDRLRAELGEGRADSARLAERSTLGDSLSELRRAVGDRIERVRALDRDRHVWPHLMDELSRALPDGVWLTSLETVRPSPDLEVRVEGRASSTLGITEYARVLEASPHVAGVRIRGSRRVTPDRAYAQSFSLLVTCRRPLTGQRRTRSRPPGGS